MARETPDFEMQPIETEEQKRAYLFSINRRENPKALERLQNLLAIHSADEVAKLCDEHGLLVYADFADPEALANRFQFVSLKKPHLVVDESKSTFDTEYYSPTVATIHEIRRLVAHATEGQELLKDQPKLVTAEDYRKYFASFDKETLEILFRELISVELTEGCNGPCRAVCGAMAQGPVTAHMPFEIVIELIDAHYAISEKSYKGMVPYYASDPADYRDGDKTAIDVYKYIVEKHGERKDYSFIFTAYSLRKTTIDFIYRCVIENLPLDRISRLTSGNRVGDFEKLMYKIEERAREDGRVLSENEKKIIRNAFDSGKKFNGVSIVGNAVKKDMPENEISSERFPCAHDISFKTGIGFVARVVRPPSRNYPGGELSWPISPKRKNHIIPESIYIATNSGPFQSKVDGFCQKPRFIHIIDGAIIEPKPTYEEEKLFFFSWMNRALTEMKKTHVNNEGRTKTNILLHTLKMFCIDPSTVKSTLPEIIQEIQDEIATNKKDLQDLYELVQYTMRIYEKDKDAIDDMIWKLVYPHEYFDVINKYSEEMIKLLRESSSGESHKEAIKQCIELEKAITEFQAYIETTIEPHKPSALGRIQSAEKQSTK